MKKISVMLMLLFVPMVTPLTVQGMEWVTGLFGGRKTSSTSVTSGTGQGEGGKVESRTVSETSMKSEEPSEENAKKQKIDKLAEKKATYEKAKIRLENELKSLPKEIDSTPPSKKPALDAKIKLKREQLENLDKELIYTNSELSKLFQPSQVSKPVVSVADLLNGLSDTEKNKKVTATVFNQAYERALQEENLDTQLEELNQIVEKNKTLANNSLKTHKVFKQIQTRITELRDAKKKIDMPNAWSATIHGKPLSDQLSIIKGELEQGGVLNNRDVDKLKAVAEAMQYYLEDYGEGLRGTDIYNTYSKYIDNVKRRLYALDPTAEINSPQQIRDAISYQKEIKTYTGAYDAAEQIFTRTINTSEGLSNAKIDKTYETLIRQLTTITNSLEGMDIKKDPITNETTDALLEKVKNRLQEIKAFKEKYDANKKAAKGLPIAVTEFDMHNELYKLPISDQLSKIKSVVESGPYNGNLDQLPQDVLEDMIDTMNYYAKNYNKGLDPEKSPFKEYDEYKLKLEEMLKKRFGESIKGQLIGKTLNDQIGIIRNFIDDKSPGNVGLVPESVLQDVIANMRDYVRREGKNFDPAISPFKEYDAYLRELENDFVRRFKKSPEEERSYINDLLNDPNSWLGQTITQARGALTGFVITTGEKVSDIAQSMNSYAETVKQQAEQMQNVPYMVQDIYATVDSLIPLIDTAKAAVKIIPGESASALYASLDGLGKKLEKLKGGQEALKGLAQWAAEAGSYLKTASEQVATYSQTVIDKTPDIVNEIIHALHEIPIEHASPEQERELLNVKDTIEEIRTRIIENEYTGRFAGIAKPIIALRDSIIKKYRAYLVKDGLRSIESAQKKYDSARKELTASLGLTSGELVQLNAGTFDLNKKLLAIRDANDADGVKQKKIVEQALKNYKNAVYRLASAYQKYQINAVALESSYAFLMHAWDAAVEKNISHDEASPLANQLREILEKRANREKYLKELEAAFEAVFVDARNALAQIHMAPYPGLTSIFNDIGHMSERLAVTMKQATTESMNMLMQDIKAIDDVVAMAEKYKEPNKKE
ncbi:MAG: hypothetical protein WCE21_02575 [Candidatus Babeliales bacterium]